MLTVYSKGKKTREKYSHHHKIRLLMKKYNKYYKRTKNIKIKKDKIKKDKRLITNKITKKHLKYL